MSAVRLHADVEAWINSEVASGRAEDPEHVVDRALRGYKAALEDFRKSLDDAEAEADRDGWLSIEEVFGPIEAELQALIEKEDHQQRTAATR